MSKWIRVSRVSLQLLAVLVMTEVEQSWNGSRREVVCTRWRPILIDAGNADQSEWLRQVK